MEIYENRTEHGTRKPFFPGGLKFNVASVKNNDNNENKYFGCVLGCMVRNITGRATTPDTTVKKWPKSNGAKATPYDHCYYLPLKALKYIECVSLTDQLSTRTSVLLFAAETAISIATLKTPAKNFQDVAIFANSTSRSKHRRGQYYRLVPSLRYEIKDK